ncbi:MAG: bifunctional hydroxymethylpyrimidine kinase/phosphomethylpyrimidine kinase, partial [Lachnospiraceae bacterium]|nr:bifunctional hydroxymethylpyrimidine kinase/phosphomethylpyrimidine kinase [Lachnospiraceae bacterium]
MINDLTGFGRCSLTVSLPIISAMKVQCCPVPTSIFSNHTAYASWFFDDFTDRMQPYIDEWKKLQLSFDGISTGFLGSEEQIQIVLRFLDDFAAVEAGGVGDAVMGEDGKPYSTYTAEMCAQMKQLAMRADILTPNLTEACILTGREYHEGRWKTEQVISLAEELAQLGPEKVVITGIPQGEFIANLCYEKRMSCSVEDAAVTRMGLACAATGWCASGRP